MPHRAVLSFRFFTLSLLVAVSAVCIIPGAAAGWWGLSSVLLLLLLLVSTVPNILVHVVRRLRVHYHGQTRIIWIHFRTGPEGLRRSLVQAFAGAKGIPHVIGAQIEGLESPIGTGIVNPLSLVASAIDSPLSDDCALALLRPYPGEGVRFRWGELQQPDGLTAAGFRQCLAANGYCLITLPDELIRAPRALLDQYSASYFEQPRSDKQRCRHNAPGGVGGVGGSDLLHGWSADGAREYFEVHRSHKLELPYPATPSGFGAYAAATFNACEEVALHVLQLLLLPTAVGEESAQQDGRQRAPVNDGGDDNITEHGGCDEETGLLLGGKCGRRCAGSTDAGSGSTGGWCPGIGGWMSGPEVLGSLRDCGQAQQVAHSCAAAPEGTTTRADDAQDSEALSTSCCRLHQYNSADSQASGAGAGCGMIARLRCQLLRLVSRCFPPLAAVITLMRGLSAVNTHADLGLVTVAPRSTLAGLLVYSRGRWKLAEAEMGPADVIVFCGHALGWLSSGAFRPLLHGVRAMGERRSLVFFLRPHATALLFRPRVEQEEAVEKQNASGQNVLAGALSANFHHLRTERKHRFVLLRPIYRWWWRLCGIGNARP